MSIIRSISSLFDQNKKPQNTIDLENRIKNLELVYLEQEKRLAELQSVVAELQFSVNIIANTCQKLSEEISILYTALNGATGAGMNMFSLNFRNSSDDDNWEN